MRVLQARDGKPAKELAVIHYALLPMSELYAALPAAEFRREGARHRPPGDGERQLF